MCTVVPGHLAGRGGESLRPGVPRAGLPLTLKKVALGDERESMWGSDCIYVGVRLYLF